MMNFDQSNEDIDGIDKPDKILPYAKNSAITQLGIANLQFNQLLTQTEFADTETQGQEPIVMCSELDPRNSVTVYDEHANSFYAAAESIRDSALIDTQTLKAT